MLASGRNTFLGRGLLRTVFMLGSRSAFQHHGLSLGRGSGSKLDTFRAEAMQGTLGRAGLHEHLVKASQTWKRIRAPPPRASSSLSWDPGDNAPEQVCL